MKNLISNTFRVLLCAVVFAALIIPKEAYAASAMITFTADKEEVRVDDVITVSLELSADVVPGAFEGYIEYDAQYLEFVTGPVCVAGGDGTLKLSDLHPDSVRNTRKYVLYFKAIKRGEAVVTMRDGAHVYDVETESVMPAFIEGITLKINASKDASADSSLSTLKISPGTLSPEFSSYKMNYSATVSENTERLIVSALTSDPKASVLVEGDKELKVGSNRVTVTVTAEDGTTAQYVITVEREGKAATEPEGRNEPEGQEQKDTTDTKTEQTSKQEGTTSAETPVTPKWAFYVTNEEGELNLNTASRYKICEAAKGVDIPEGFVQTSIIISGNTITAYTKEGEAHADWLLLVLQKEDSEPALYRYDRVEKTIQRYIREVVEVEVPVEKEVPVAKTGGIKDLFGGSVIVIVILCVLAVLLAVWIIASAIERSSRKKKKSSSNRNSKSTRGNSY